MISGAYLGPLCLATIQAAVGDGLFSKKAADQLAKVQKTETKDISLFLASPEGSDNILAKAIQSSEPQDAAALSCLVEAVVERAAKLTAINLSSAVLKSGKGQDPDRPVCIVAEGTTFYKLHGLQATIESYLEQYLDQRGRYCEIASVDDATLIGAAIAGLTN
jgi:hexokinase